MQSPLRSFSLVLELIHVSGYDLSVQQSVHDINPNGRNLLSRNLPVAMVVGVAGFIGSHVAEKLLSLNVQVIGVDNFSSGKKEHLTDFGNHKLFYFLEENVDNLSSILPLESMPRLDYVFYFVDPLISQNADRSLAALLEFVAKVEDLLLRKRSAPDSDRIKKISPCKIVFSSSVFLYDNHLAQEVEKIKAVETILASLSREFNLNARIVRLIQIYGPRMDFRDGDPLGRLIKACVEKKLSDESTVLDFSSRDLFITDAVNLIIKSVLSGVTSNKIYDGARLYPVSVAEVKELLLSNLDQSVQTVKLTKLPAWPTPNLIKTMRELSWSPRSDFIESLRKTIDYFKENPGEEKENFGKSPLPIHGWSFKQYQHEIPEETDSASEDEEFVEEEEPKNNWSWPIVLIISLLIITVGIIYPAAVTAGAYYFIPKNTQIARVDLLKNDFDDANKQLDKASLWANLSGQVLQPFILFTKLLDMPIGSKLQKIQSINNSVGDLQSVGSVTSNLDNCMQAVFSNTGTSGQDCDLSAQVYQSYYNLLQNDQNGDFLNQFNQARGADLFLSQLNTNEQSSSANRNYLVLWEDNFQLKPNGGEVKDAILLNFQNDKFDHQDTQTEAKLLPILNNLLGVSPLDPKKVEDTLDTTADFPVFASTAGATFTQFLGQPVDGVVSVDTTAMINLVNLFGPIKDDDGSPLTGDEILSKGQQITDPAQRDLFYKKSFEQMITQLTASGISLANLSEISTLVSQKHLQFFDSNSKLESFIISQNSGGVFPKFDNDPEQSPQDFLSLYQIDASGSSQMVQKKISLATTIDNEQIKQTGALDVGTSDQDRLFLLFIPLGSKINSMTQNNKTVSPASFVEFGESGYTFSVPGKSDGLINLDYNLPSTIKFTNNNSEYNFYLQKQPGEGDNHFSQSLQLGDNLQFADGSNLKQIDQDFDSDFSENLLIKK